MQVIKENSDDYEKFLMIKDDLLFNKKSIYTPDDRC